LIPLLPYFLYRKYFYDADCFGILTGITLAVFGAVKGRLTGANMIKSSVQTLLVRAR